MTQIINPQGYIEDEQNGGRMNVVSSDMTDAKIDPQGYFYKEETINGITGRMPVVSVEGMDGGEETPQTIPTLQQVTDAAAVTTNPITAGLAVTDAQLPTLGQAKSLLLPRSDKNADGSVYVHQNVLMWENKIPSFTGVIKILLPVGWTYTMLQFEIDLYNYVLTSGGSKLLVNGYNTPTNGWLVSNTAVSGIFPYSIRLGYDSVAGKCCILLGNTASSWAYTSLVIRSVKATGSSQPQFGSGYSASVITDETGLTNIVTPNKIGYEEGSWTPSIQGSITAGVANYTNRVGSYIKIGNKVTLTMFISGTFTTAPAGAVRVYGIPFVPATHSTKGVGVGASGIGYANSSNLFYASGSGSTTNYLLLMKNYTSNSAVPVANFATDISAVNFDQYTTLTYFI